jgi:protein phosphatase PTC7
MGQFSYDVAASFIAKDHAYKPSKHVFHFNPYNHVQPAKKPNNQRPESGHDAFFISRVGDSGAVAMGVADGVGGWVDSGVDPADFSHSFCDYMAVAAYSHEAVGAGVAAKGEEKAQLTARSLMQKGYDAVCHDGSVRAGGSTACVAIASPGGSLDVANLGDSGFLQLRLNAVHACSEPQTHAFNTPFQLSVVPPSVAARMAAFGGAQLSDMPRDADVARHSLRHGDVLVFGSDGLWDNLFNQDVLRVVSRVMTASGAWVMTNAGGIRVADNLTPYTKPNNNGDAPKSPDTKPLLTLQSALAIEITGAAKAASINTKLDGPFAKEVKRYFPHEPWHGGKVDDICVVVAIVSEASGGKIKSRL